MYTKVYRCFYFVHILCCFSLNEPLFQDPPATEPSKLVFVEDLKEQIYIALKPKELAKIIQCRYCPRKFKFLSEHLSHLKKHTQDVDSVVEMSIKIWVNIKKKFLLRKSTILSNFAFMHIFVEGKL